MNYRPDPSLQLSRNEIERDEFHYTVEDPHGITGQASAFVSVVGLNTTPVANSAQFSINEDEVLSEVLIASDVDGDSLTFAAETTPANGILSLQSDGTFTYTPNPNFHGVDSFTFSASDASESSLAATVDITITPVNDVPGIDVDLPSIVVNEGDTTSNSGTWGDIDGDTVSITASIGTMTQDATTWNWEFVATDGPDETQTVTVTIEDGDGLNTSASFDLVVNNELPLLATGTDQVVFEDESVSLDLTFTDAGILDTHLATVDWGDSSGEESLTVTETNGAGAVAGSHVYQDPGLYTVTVCITDDDAPSSQICQSFNVSVVHSFLGYAVFGAGSDRETKKKTRKTELHDSAVIDGNLGALGDIGAKANGSVTGEIVSHQASVKLGKGATVMGDIHAGKDVGMEIESHTLGNVIAGKKVSLKKEAEVGGDVTAGGSVKLDSKSVVGGAVTENATIAALPVITSLSLKFSAGGDDVEVEKKQIKTLSPGNFGTLDARDEANLQLESGAYSFKEIELGKKTGLALNLTAGPIIINVTGDIAVKDHVKMTLIGGSAEDVLFRIGGSKLDLGRSGTFHGTFLAPYANAELKDDSILTGALFAESAQIRARARVNYQAAISLFVEEVVRVDALPVIARLLASSGQDGVPTSIENQPSTVEARSNDSRSDLAGELSSLQPVSLSIKPIANSEVRLIIRGNSKTRYSIQGSSDLNPNGWRTIQTITTSPVGLFEFIDSNVEGRRLHFFYRVAAIEQ